VKIKQSYLKEVIADFLHNKRAESGESCPSNEDLVSWIRSKLPKKEKNRITDHIVNCCQCGQKVQELMDRIRKEDGIIYEIKKRIDANYPEPSQEALVPPRRLSGRIVSSASVLVLLAAITTLSIFNFSSRSDFRRGVSSDIILVSPINKSCHANELKFVWKSQPYVKYCFVEVFDSSLALLWRSNAVFQPVVIPPNDMLQKLASKETYYWMVTSVFLGGNKFKSRLIKFKIF
jgi:hypothetical protein